MAPRKPKTPKSLTEALHDLLPRLEDDLRARSDAEPALRSALEEEHRAAIKAHRTGETFNAWRDEVVTQIAVAWVLACVFVRFLEDNELVEIQRISGSVTPQDRRKRAIEEQEAYFQRHPTENERDYLEATFRELSKLPSLGALLGPANTNLWRFGPSAEGAKLLLEFFRRLDDEGSEARLRFPFIDPSRSTRFLGDLYQNLSEDAQKRYALLQTPIFVEEFILDRTLEPALAEFGLHGLRMIDPTVGSGHFLLGGFARLLDRWQKAEPGTEVRVLVQRALDGLFGVDLNPFAVEICRFRLLIAALRASDVKRLADAPSFHTNIVVGDSLLHGPRFNDPGRAQERFEFPDIAEHTYRHEDKAELAHVLGQRYHVVVGNPPYITVKDKALNEVYRERYGSCLGRYHLSAPFLERFVELSLPREGGQAGGFVGQITDNAFMTREFGVRLIEEFVSRWDLTHVIDTSGAYVPGHGTPTVILFLRNRPPIGSTVRTVLGIRGEPSTPDDPTQGCVWRAIVEQIDHPGSQTDFVNVEDRPRESFNSHPWILGGGGAADLKRRLDKSSVTKLTSCVDTIGFASFPGQDAAFVAWRGAFNRHRVEQHFVFAFVTGDTVRDWAIRYPDSALVTVDSNFQPIELDIGSHWYRFLWPNRRVLASTQSFAATREKLGEPWWMWYRWIPYKYRVRLSIAFAFNATHNHFVLDRGGKVFKQSAPVIKLRPNATEGDHFALLGLLNSSAACFWLKQVCHNKGSTVDELGARQTTIEFENFYEFTAGTLAELPVPSKLPELMSRRIDQRAQELAMTCDGAWLCSAPSARQDATVRSRAHAEILGDLVALQEELDWRVYAAFGLIDEHLCAPDDKPPPPLELGERSFEIAMARACKNGAPETTWFTRHGSRPITELPMTWPDWYRELVDRRIAAIQSDRDLGLIERPEFKRRWNLEPFDSIQRRAVRERILDLVEEMPVWRQDNLAPITVRVLAEMLAASDDINALVACYTDGSATEVEAVLVEILETEHVPYLAAFRYKDSGLSKRKDWERTWELQRMEDKIDTLVGLPKGHPKRIDEAGASLRKRLEIGDVPVPEKYGSVDFQKGSYWSNRGKLDVPKERFIS